MKQYDAHVRELRKLQKEVERLRVIRGRIESNSSNGRPRVDRTEGYDPLLDKLIREHGKK